MQRQARLVVEGRGSWVYTHSLEGVERVTIGRTSASDIELGDPHASSLHAEIVRQGEGFWLRDLGSRNGTLLNGKKVEEAQLHNNDAICIGASTLSFLNEADKLLDSIAEPLDRVLCEPSLLSAGEAFRPMLARMDKLRYGTDDSHSAVPLAETAKDLQDDLEKAQKTISRLMLINEFTLALTAEETPLGMLTAALKFAAEKTKAENGFIMQFDPTAKKCIVRARYGTITDWLAPGEDKDQAVPLSLSIVDRVIKTGKPVFTQSALDDSRFQEALSVQALGIQSCLCVPMVAEGETKGVGYLDRRSSSEPFTKQDEELITALTDQLSSILYPKA